MIKEKTFEDIKHIDELGNEYVPNRICRATMKEGVYLDKHYKNIRKLIENNLVETKKYEIISNYHTLMTYYNIGKEITEAQGGETRAKYGTALIKEYSALLEKEYGAKYGRSNLMLMRQLYLTFPKVHTLYGQLSWSIYKEILPIKNENKVLILNNEGEWVFPKGHVEEGETFEEAAIRELEEGTRVKVDKSQYVGQVGEFKFYFDGEKAVKVIKVLMFIINEFPEIFYNKEEGFVDGIWIDIKECIDKLTHDDAREALKKGLEKAKIPIFY